MIDFQERVRARNAEKVADDAADTIKTAAFLQCLEEIAMQFYFAVMAWEGTTSAADIMKKALPVIGARQFHLVAMLCDVHGKNMAYITGLLEKVAGKPDAAELKELQEDILINLPARYRENGEPLIDRMIDRYLEDLERTRKQ